MEGGYGGGGGGKRCVTDVSNDILTSSVIFYITNPWQHGIYLFENVKETKQKFIKRHYST